MLLEIKLTISSEKNQIVKVIWSMNEYKQSYINKIKYLTMITNIYNQPIQKTRIHIYTQINYKEMTAAIDVHQVVHPQAPRCTPHVPMRPLRTAQCTT